MAERPDNLIEDILGNALRRVRVPEPSADFDDRVIAALRARRTWWQALLLAARPVASAAACSLVVMLAALHWALPANSSSSQHPQPAPLSAPVAPAQDTVTLAALNKALDRPDLRFGTIDLLFAASTPPEPAANSRAPANPPPAGRPPAPPKRDSLAPHSEPVLA